MNQDITSLYDNPNKNYITNNSDLIIVELDNYDMLSLGSINFNIFAKLLRNLFDDKSRFYNWYIIYHSQVKNVDQQYDALKESLYFDENLDIIHDKIKNIIEIYDTQVKSEPITNIPRTELKIQTGGILYNTKKNIKRFIVGAVKYITGDNNTETTEIKNFTSEFNKKSIEINHIIDELSEYYGRNHSKIQDLHKYNCYMALYYFAIHKLNFMVNKKFSKLITKYDEHINKITTACIKITGKNYNDYKIKAYGNLNFSNKQEIKNRITELIELCNEYDLLINNDIKYLSENIPDQDETREIKYRSHQYQSIKFNDISGLEKIDQRRIFLIKTNESDYAIKLATPNHPQYLYEAIIYKKFNQIMSDKDEPKASIIQDTILNYYYVGNLNIPRKTHKIFLTQDLMINVSAKNNYELYEAINELCKENNVNQVIYYTTENILNDWSSLYNTRMSTEDKCYLTTNVIKLLTYLNSKYNFVHWDLHSNNILINKKNHNRFKIFDFDMSEITYNGNSTSVNNTLMDTLNINELQNVNTNNRKNIGLIYDVYRIQDSFNSYNYCNYKNLRKIIELKDTINKYDQAIPKIENKNIWIYLLLISMMANSAYEIDRKPVANWIRDNFTIDTIDTRNMYGGNPYMKKYYKYKAKYIKLKTNN